MLPKWTPSAKQLLSQRDRFTQKAIVDDFGESVKEASEPPSTSVEFDKDKRGFITPVMDDRYGVVWYQKDDTAEVRAIVPTTRFHTGMDNLKERVKKVVSRESEGLILLEE